MLHTKYDNAQTEASAEDGGGVMEDDGMMKMGTAVDDGEADIQLGSIQPNMVNDLGQP